MSKSKLNLINQTQLDKRISKLEKELNKYKAVKLARLESERDLISNQIRNLGGANSSDESIKIETISAKRQIVKKSMKRMPTNDTIAIKDRLIQIASDKQVRNTNEYLQALEATGWTTTSTKPYYVVATALASLVNKNVFTRVAKGSYQIIEQQPVQG